MQCCKAVVKPFFLHEIMGKPWKIPLSRGVVLKVLVRAVCKRLGPGISLGYYEHDPWLLLYETKGKLNQKNFLAVQFPAY